MKLAFYLRLSLADGDLGKNNKDESNSIENQRLILQNFVESMDELDGDVTEYVDDGHTGTNFNRPAFQAMVEDAKRGKIEVILVKDLSRIGRDYIGVGDYLEQIFPILGVRVIAVNSQYDSNNYIGNTMGLEMSISNLINTLYSRDLSKKFKSCVQTKWKKGISTYGRVPFGYKKGEGQQWEIDPEPAKIIRLVFELALQDYSTLMIANELNERGIPTPGKFRKQRKENIVWNRKVADEEWLWDARMVWMTLRNYTYTGALVQGKTSNIRVGSTERRRTKKHQQFITENHHKGIVTHEEFEDAQSVIGKQKERGFVQDSGFSLKGKVTCGNCKLKMMYNYGAVPVVYCAHTSAAGKMSTCDKTRHKVKKIERIVLNALRRQLEIFKQLAKKLEEEQKNKQTDLPAIQKEMEKQLETLREERIRQYEAYAEGMTDQECYLKVKKELNQKIDKIQEKYERLLTITTEDGELMKEIQVVKQEAEQAEVFDKMTRHIAETFIDEVIIYDAEKIEIRFLFDDLIAEMTEKIEREKKEDVAV